MYGRSSLKACSYDHNYRGERNTKRSKAPHQTTSLRPEGRRKWAGPARLNSSLFHAFYIICINTLMFIALAFHLDSSFQQANICFEKIVLLASKHLSYPGFNYLSVVCDLQGNSEEEPSTRNNGKRSISMQLLNLSGCFHL